MGNNRAPPREWPSNPPPIPPDEQGEEEQAENDPHPASPVSFLSPDEEEDYSEVDDESDADAYTDWEAELEREFEAADWEFGGEWDLETGDGLDEVDTEWDEDGVVEAVERVTLEAETGGEAVTAYEFQVQAEVASGDQAEATYESQDESAPEGEEERELRIQGGQIRRLLLSHSFKNRVEKRELLLRQQTQNELIDYPVCFLIVVCTTALFLFALTLFLYANWYDGLMEK